MCHVVGVITLTIFQLPSSYGLGFMMFRRFLYKRDKGTKGQRDKGTKGQRDKGTKGQRDKGTKGKREKGTKGQRDKGTKKQWDKGTKLNEKSEKVKNK